MKKFFYILAWGVLMLIISFLAHALIEMRILANAEKTGAVLQWVNFSGRPICALPAWLFYSLPIAAVVLGIWAGFFFWQKVYVKK